MRQAHFPGKLLLFGEYGILKGGQALAMPLPLYAGGWSKEGQPQPGLNLLPFVEYLESLQSDGALLTRLDVGRFRKEAEEGLHFQSNIPMGYGAGSSGALCAAVYSRYAHSPLPPDDEAAYPALRVQLAQLEAFFHGESSGTDPVIAYLQRAVLLRGKAIELAPPIASRAEGQWVLLDTGISRSTAPLVERFLRCCDSPLFERSLRAELLPATEQAIACYLAGDSPGLMRFMLAISEWQLGHLKAFIPTPFRDCWAAGLARQDYALKLCGAGGGGFLLAYTYKDLMPGPLAAASAQVIQGV